MEKIAHFEKVSFDEFKKDFLDTFPNYPENEVKRVYDEIQLPKRATKGSAGYDFNSPISFSLEQNDTIKIPTGIRVVMNEGYVLMIFPRSGLGFKYRLQLDNSVGIIDSDYSHALNEGHIFIKITNDSKIQKTLLVKEGSAFAQGIFVPFGITVDDEANDERVGGFGSTTK